MIILNSNVEMAANRHYQETSKTEERLLFWKGNPPNADANTNRPQSQLVSALAVPLDTVDISSPASSILPKEDEWKLPEHEEIKLRALLTMIEALTGKKLKFKFLSLKGEEDQARLENARNSAANPPFRAGWGIEYDYSHTYFEHESVDFGASGKVITADGREIDFSLNMSMSRTFYMQEEFSLRLGDAARPIDPLVINFNTGTASLSASKFAFDLDNDGQSEMISFVNPGSGFLALDLNNDGIINNGSELFGPQTGNGFGELSQYDSDGNNWIDENDPIYDKLRIWTKDENGNDVLFALGQLGIGAIFLGSASTPFVFKDESNQAHGQVQSSGVFLHENGKAGIIQQIDLFA